MKEETNATFIAHRSDRNHTEFGLFASSREVPSEASFSRLIEQADESTPQMSRVGPSKRILGRTVGLIGTLVALGTFSPVLESRGQSIDRGWQTTDNVQDGSLAHLCADSAGTIYAAGYLRSPSASAAVPALTRTVDGGATWTDLAVPTVYNPNAITVAESFDLPNGGTPGAVTHRLLICGRTAEGLAVHYSDDAGSNWFPLGDVIPSPPSYKHPALARAMAVRADLTIFLFTEAVIDRQTVTKKGTTTTSELHCVGYKLAPGLQAWEQIIDQVTPWNRSAVAIGMNVFILGPNDGFFNILRYDSNGTWQNVDHIQLQAGLNCVATRLSKDPDGNLIACGIGARSGKGRDQVSHWWVRRGSGLVANSFRTIGAIPHDGAQPLDLTVRNDTVFVTGSAVGGEIGDYSLRRWFTYAGVPSMQNGTEVWAWNPSDMFYLNPRLSAAGRHIISDTNGNVLAGGNSLGTDGSSNDWITRRLQQ